MKTGTSCINNVVSLSGGKDSTAMLVAPRAGAWIETWGYHMTIHAIHRVIDLSEHRKKNEKKKYAHHVLKAFEDIEHSRRRDFLEEKAKVERKARGSF